MSLLQQYSALPGPVLELQAINQGAEDNLGEVQQLLLLLWPSPSSHPVQVESPVQDVQGEAP